MSGDFVREITKAMISRSAGAIEFPTSREGVVFPPLTAAVDAVLRELHEREQLVLPDLGAPNQTIGIFSDYAGDDRGSDFVSYSFLLMAYNYHDVFGEEVQRLRQKFMMSHLEKEIAYKDRGFGPIARALPGYLEALDDRVAGWLVSVAVDKRLKTVMGFPGHEGEEEIRKQFESAGVGGWKTAVGERVLRVAHLASYLLAVVVGEGQKVFWMTDNDDIVANQTKGQRTMRIFQSLIPEYTRKRVGTVGWAVPFQDPRSMVHEDLLSATDLACGAISGHLRLNSDEAAATKAAEPIVRWLSRDGVGLRKILIRLVLADGGHLLANQLVAGEVLRSDCAE